MITAFNANKHHIYVKLFLPDPRTGEKQGYNCILDTGAPWSEIDDHVLVRFGLIDKPNPKIHIEPGLQTKKYGVVTLPDVEICGHTLHNFEVKISKFKKEWALAGLIGLDFFRKFRTTIDYQKGQIVTEPLS